MLDINGLEITAGTYPCYTACLDIRSDAHRHEFYRLYQVTPQKMPEVLLQRAVLTMCRVYGLTGFHEQDSRRQVVKGWPDLVIIGGSKILWRELKSESGAITVEQRRVGSILAKSSEDWAIWRPSTLFSGSIERTLAEITRG